MHDMSHKGLGLCLRGRRSRLEVFVSKVPETCVANDSGEIART